MNALTIQQRQALKYASTQNTARHDLRAADAEFRQPTNHLAPGLRQLPKPTPALVRLDRFLDFVLNKAPVLCGLACFFGWLLWLRAQGGMP